MLGLRALPDKSVDHIICDPPYDEHTHTKGVKHKGQNKDGSYRGNYHRDFGFDAITEEQMDAFAKEIARVCRGWVLLFCADDAMKAWRTALERYGVRWRRYCYWIKLNPMPKLHGDCPGQGTEVFVAAWNGEGRSTWNRGGRANTWTYQRGGGGIHKTGKPLSLMTDLILSFTRPGDLICDPFAGGGTTLIAAKQTGRQAFGWEIDEEMYAKALPLVEAAREQLRMFENHFRDDTTMRSSAFSEEPVKKTSDAKTEQLGWEL